MSYQEKKSIVNIISAMLITLIYAWIIYNKHMAGQFDLTEDYRTWGYIFLIFIGVSILARIVIYIIFHIINAIATQEEDIPVTDERDKLIELKATRNSYHVFSGGLAMALISMTIGMTPVFLFIAFFACCLLSEIVENISQIYYHRIGV
jgi:hypothetical protein